ncbi:MAG: dCMP deaminase family protein [Candidatus Acidiferrales bacterium]
MSKPEILQIPAHVDNWDEYFLYMAMTASIKSKDPKCPVGAVIVSQDHVLLSTGFNGFARGVYDDEQTLFNADEKLKVICHAEFNAILNAARVGARVEGTTIYVSKFPCLSCCNAIIQAGVKRIYTHDSEFWKDDPFDKDHTLKQRVLHEAHIHVDAPYHPTYCPKTQITVPKRKPGAKRATPGPMTAVSKTG